MFMDTIDFQLNDGPPTQGCLEEGLGGARPTVIDLRTGNAVAVPSVNFWICGFECYAISNLNTAAAEARLVGSVAASAEGKLAKLSLPVWLTYRFGSLQCSCCKL